MRTIVFFLFISLCLSANAQLYKEGFVITNNSDTIRGFIANESYSENSKKCSLKKTESSDAVIYLPGDIKAYKFTDGKYYVSRKITVNGDSIKAFLEYIIHGSIDVYYYRGDNKEHYFVENPNYEIKELVNDVKEVNDDGKYYLWKSNRYIGTLKLALPNNNPEISKQIEETTLDHKSLISLVKKYQKVICKNDVCVIYEKKIPNIIKFGVLAGVSMNTLSVSKDLPPQFYYWWHSNFNWALSPSLGLYFYKNIPAISERAGIQYEIEFIAPRTLETVNSEPASGGHLTYINTLSYTYSSLKNTLLFRYIIQKQKISPLLFLGIYMDNSFVSESSGREEDRWDNGSGTTMYQSYVPEAKNKVDYGFTVGTGLEFRFKSNYKLNLEVSYSMGYMPIDLKGIKSNIFAIKAGIPFGK